MNTTQDFFGQSNSQSGMIIDEITINDVVLKKIDEQIKSYCLVLITQLKFEHELEKQELIWKHQQEISILNTTISNQSEIITNLSNQLCFVPIPSNAVQEPLSLPKINCEPIQLSNITDIYCSQGCIFIVDEHNSYNIIKSSKIFLDIYETVPINDDSKRIITTSKIPFNTFKDFYNFEDNFGLPKLESTRMFNKIISDNNYSIQYKFDQIIFDIETVATNNDFANHFNNQAFVVSI